MANHAAHQTTIEVVHGAPEELDAGTPVTLTLRVRCSEGCTLSSAPVRFSSEHGDEIEVKRIERMPSGDVELEALAPAAVGEVHWTVWCARHESEGGVHEESASAEIRFKAVAHRTSMAVWDVRSPVAAGSTLAAKVGVRCTAACALTGVGVRLLDEEGTRVGDGRLGTTPCTGTGALYWTEVEFTAPDTEGLTVRRAELAADEAALPHEPAEASFTFMTTRRPDCDVAIAVVDASSAGLAEVEVHVGQYHVMTDRAGSARVEVPSGSYEVTIRRDGFSADPIQLDAVSAVTLRIEARKVPTMAERAETLTSFEGYPWG